MFLGGVGRPGSGGVTTFYNHDGEPITLAEWAMLVEIPGYSRIASTVLGDVWVSTVWLGIDHAPWDDRVLHIFETMIFPECDYMERTGTKEAALAAHDQAVAHVDCGEYAKEVKDMEHEARREESERN